MHTIFSIPCEPSFDSLGHPTHFVCSPPVWPHHFQTPRGATYACVGRGGTQKTKRSKNFLSPSWDRFPQLVGERISIDGFPTHKSIKTLPRPQAITSTLTLTLVEEKHKSFIIKIFLTQITQERSGVSTRLSWTNKSVQTVSRPRDHSYLTYLFAFQSTQDFWRQKSCLNSIQQRRHSGPVKHRALLLVLLVSPHIVCSPTPRSMFQIFVQKLDILILLQTPHHCNSTSFVVIELFISHGYLQDLPPWPSIL